MKRAGWYGSGSVPLTKMARIHTPLDSSVKFDAGMKVLMHAQLDAGNSYLRERLSLLSRGDKLWRSFSETRGENGIKLMLSPKETKNMVYIPYIVVDTVFFGGEREK
jgi:hypothetical protein